MWPPPMAREQASLPFSEGGCGVRIPSNVQLPARVAALCAYEVTGRTAVGAPSFTHTEPPPDLGPLLTSLTLALGPTFDPLPNWGRNWLAIQSASTKEHRSQGWWQDAFFCGGGNFPQVSTVGVPLPYQRTCQSSSPQRAIPYIARRHALCHMRL